VTTDVIQTSPQGHPTSLRVRGGEERVEARVSSALTIWRVKIGGQEASKTQSDGDSGVGYDGRRGGTGGTTSDTR
jgi:hypothetical protein